MSNALKFPLQKQTCQNKKIKVGLQLVQFLLNLILQKIGNYLRVDGSRQDLTQRDLQMV